MTRQGGWPATGFAARLKAERERAGLSQKQLAEKVGCHYMTISKLELGTQEPAWPLVLACAHALGVSCEALHDPASETAAVPPEQPPARSKGEAVGEQAGKDKPAGKGRGKKGKGE